MSSIGMSSQPQSPANLTVESTSVQNYLNILQGIISRMATNSSSCKTWCISLVSAILVVIADKNKPDYAWIALIPIILFFLLDAYYLGQERSFRAIYNDFIEKLQAGRVQTKDLFVLKPLRGSSVVTSIYKATFSFAIYPFYLTLLATVIIARYLIL
jgi:hypothetical protein